jgi:hypothetical protein
MLGEFFVDWINTNLAVCLSKMLFYSHNSQAHSTIIMLIVCTVCVSDIVPQLNFNIVSKKRAHSYINITQGVPIAYSNDRHSGRAVEGTNCLRPLQH